MDKLSAAGPFSNVYLGVAASANDVRTTRLPRLYGFEPDLLFRRLAYRAKLVQERPSVTDMTRKDAEQALANSKLGMEVIGSIPGDVVTPTVAKQDPLPDTNAREGSVVRVTMWRPQAGPPP